MSDPTPDAKPGLQGLLDERDILRALARFARIADAKKFASLAEVFDDEVEFDYGSGQLEHGITALQALLRRHLDRCGGTQHLIGSVLVDVDGDRAISRAYVQARHQRAGDFAGPVFDSNGEYIDRWERRAPGWRIVNRKAEWAVNTGDIAVLAEDGQLG
jgi:hypothetical protein